MQTKPHGHGDVHSLLHSSGLAKQWAADGFAWVCFFQDTNALVFRALVAALGVSARHDYCMNSIAVPRKAKVRLHAALRRAALCCTARWRCCVVLHRTALHGQYAHMAMEHGGLSCMQEKATHAVAVPPPGVDNDPNEAHAAMQHHGRPSTGAAFLVAHSLTRTCTQLIYAMRMHARLCLSMHT